METISQQNMYEIIASELPEATEEIHKPSSRYNPAAMIQAVVNYVKDCLSAHEIADICYTMSLMGQVYNTSDRSIRDIVENMFVRSFGSLKRHCTANEWEQIESSIPGSLYAIYFIQNNH